MTIVISHGWKLQILYIDVLILLLRSAVANTHVFAWLHFSSYNPSNTMGIVLPMYRRDFLKAS